MGVWVELRCGLMLEGRGCTSDRNEGPRGYFPDTQAGWQRAKVALNKQARASAWVKTVAHGWVCAACHQKPWP